MAGLLKPRSAPLLVEAIRSVTDLPIHFHTHATSSCSLATALEMARAGCDVSSANEKCFDVDSDARRETRTSMRVCVLVVSTENGPCLLAP